MISIQNLRKSFGPLEVLKGIDIDLKNRGITAILGPNGSGKTTLIKCLLGMVLPDKGSLFIDNQPINNQFLYRSKIGYLPQIALFPSNLSVEELFQMVKDLRGQKEASEKDLVALFELEPFLKKKLGNLSGGTKQKVNLTICFMFDPDLYILDEPTAGLDPLALFNFKQLLLEEKKKGKQILITSHIMGLVEELADEIIFLMDGKVYYQGTVQELESQYGESNLEKSIANILKRNKTGGQAKYQEPKIPFRVFPESV